MEAPIEIVGEVVAFDVILVLLGMGSVCLFAGIVSTEFKTVGLVVSEEFVADASEEFGVVAVEPLAAPVVGGTVDEVVVPDDIEVDLYDGPLELNAASVKVERRFTHATGVESDEGQAEHKDSDEV